MNEINKKNFAVDIRKVDTNIEKMIEVLTSENDEEYKTDYLEEELTSCSHVIHPEEIQTFLYVLKAWRTQIKNRLKLIANGKKLNTIPDDRCQFKIGIQMTSSTIDGIGCMFPTILTDILASKIDEVGYLTLFLPYDYSLKEEAGSLLSEAIIIFDRIMDSQRATHIFVTGIPETLRVYNSIHEDLYPNDDVCLSSSLTMDEYFNVNGEILYTNIDHHRSFVSEEAVISTKGEVRVSGIQDLIECGLEVDKKVLGVADSFETLEDRFRELDEEDWCYGVPISSTYITFAVFIKLIDQLLSHGEKENWIEPYRQIAIKLQLLDICRGISGMECDYEGCRYEAWKKYSVMTNINMVSFHHLSSINTIVDYAYRHILDEKMTCIPKEYLCSFDTIDESEDCIARAYTHNVVAIENIPRGESTLNIEDKHPWLICELPPIGNPIWVGYYIMHNILYQNPEETPIVDASGKEVVDAKGANFNGIIYFERRSNRILIFFYRNEDIDGDKVMTSIAKQYNYHSSLNWSTIELYDPEMKNSIMSIYDKKNKLQF